MPEQWTSETAHRRAPAATQEDVARELSISRTLVSLALRDRPGVSASMRQRILETADRLGYRRNSLAAELAQRQRTAVGLHLLDAHNDVYTTILSSVQAVIAPVGRRLVLAVNSRSGRDDPQPRNTLLEANVGVIISATSVAPDDEVRTLNRIRPVILVARRVEGVDSVYVEHDVGARAAVEHLAGLGHTRIAHLTGPSFEGHTQRRAGYLEAMRSLGLTPEIATNPGFAREEAFAAARVLLDRPASERPTAVFTHNDELALAVREAAADLGLRVPEDLSVVGFDNSRAAGLTGVDLTTVDIRGDELGRAAAEAAIRRLEHPGVPPLQRGFTPSLVVRRSTAPPRGV
ncbi:LacI family DNA-binding transcriptional regulator [Zhihengliuella halotolerans]|uniref:LacI family DNA-binding transcriptional regulator n=1 Tax=Zhihengliuella halotolerans TaxID=370736 RepID=UPI000C80D1FF|nr:LacI family DNA-binding transcriptional regulator [Zhihengliuella halotolerans]